MSDFSQQHSNRVVGQYLKLLPIVLLLSPAGYIFGLVYAHITTVDQFGEINLLLSLFSIAIPVFSIGLAQSFPYFFPDYEKKGCSYRTGLILFSVLMTVIVSVVISLLITVYGIKTKSNIVIYGAFGFFLLAIIRLCSQYSKAIGKNYWALINSRFALSMMPLLIGIILLCIGRDYPDYAITLAVIVGLIITALIQMFLSMIVFVKMEKAKPSYELRRWFSFSIPFMYNRIVGAINVYGQIIVVDIFLGSQAVAIYVAAFLTMRILRVPRQVFGFIVERLIKQSLQSEKQVVKKRLLSIYFIATFIPSVILFVLMLLFGDDLLLLLGKEYIVASQIFIIILIGGFVGLFLDILRQLLTFSGFVYRVASFNTIFMLVSISMSIILAYTYGLQGIVIGYLVGRVVALIMFVLLAVYSFGVQRR